MDNPKGTNISTLSSRSQPGLFGRLLQRTKSIKERRRSTGKDAPSSGTTHLAPGPENRHKDFRALKTKIQAAPQPDRQLPVVATATTNDTMGAPVVFLQQHQSRGLRTRASIRDKLRALAHDTPTPDPEQEAVREKPQRFVYVPTHAASDFSRLVVSPRPSSRHQQRYSSDEPPTFLQRTGPINTIAGDLAADDLQLVVGLRPYSPGGLQTLAEHEPAQPNPREQSQIPHQGQDRLDQEQPRSHQQWSHKATDFRRSSPTQTTTLSTPANAAKRNRPEFVESATPSETGSAEEEEEQKNRSPSDYELFLARAEERDRTHRDHLIHKLSQRHYPSPEPEAPPYVYHTADSAVATDASVPSRRGWEGRVSGLDSGIGSKSSSQQETTAQASGGTWERGHRKRYSWTPSSRQSGRDNLEGVPEATEGHQGYKTTNTGHMFPPADWSYAAQQPRTLTKQASIAKRLGEYIKPAKTPTSYEQPKYEPGNTRSEVKKGISKRLI